MSAYVNTNLKEEQKNELLSKGYDITPQKSSIQASVN